MKKKTKNGWDSKTITRDYNAVELKLFGRAKLQKTWWLIGVADLRKYNIRGTCGTPKRRSMPGIVAVSSHLPRKGKLFRVAAIHEALHAAFPELEEKEVERGAFFLDKVLKAYKV